jgi:hypothetical protein
MPHLNPAPSDYLDFVKQVAEDYQPDLVNAGVTFGCLLVSPTEKEMGSEPPHLKAGGLRLPAFAKITNDEGQASRLPDVVVKVCEESYRAADEGQRVAFVDEALERLELVKDKQGHLKTTSRNRPKLRGKTPDIQVSGFRRSLTRHGKVATVATQLAGVIEEYTQRMLAWGDDAAEQDARPSSDEVLGVVG